MAKKIQPQSPAEAKPAATATCPQAQDTSASPEPVSVVCATNIACETQAPFCPEKESQFKPHTIGHTGWHTCLAHTQDMPGCTTVTSTPEAAGAAPQTIGTWFHGCGIPPVTLTCPQQAAPQAGNIGITGWYTCHQGTAATVCTQVGCTPATHLLGCTTATTPPAAAQAGTIGVTGWYTCHQGTAATVCTQVQCTPATHLLGCTTVTANPVTNPAICGTGPQAAAQVGPTGWYTCHQGTAATVCTQVECTPATHLLGCTTVTANPHTNPAICGTGPQAAAQVGPTGWYTCHQGTAATVCTQVGCTPATHLLGCTTATTPPAAAQAGTIGVTGWYTCHQGTAATVCTQVECTPATHLLGCTTVTANPHTNPAICGTGPQAAAQVGPTGWYTCHQGTAATVCTQVQCTPATHLLGCTTVTANPVTNPAICGTGPQAAAQVGPTGWYTCHQQGSTLATVCTQVGCAPTHLLGCTTATTPPQAGTIGVTGWYTCGHVPTCGQNTRIVATTYTQIGC